jgi:hypothetical protein
MLSICIIEHYNFKRWVGNGGRKWMRRSPRQFVMWEKNYRTMCILYCLLPEKGFSENCINSTGHYRRANWWGRRMGSELHHRPRWRSLFIHGILLIYWLSECITHFFKLVFQLSILKYYRFTGGPFNLTPNCKLVPATK